MKDTPDQHPDPAADEQQPGREANSPFVNHVLAAFDEIAAGGFSSGAIELAASAHLQPALDALAAATEAILLRREEREADAKRLKAKLRHEREVARLAADRERRELARAREVERRADRATALSYMFWATVTSCVVAGVVGDFDGAAAVLVAFGGLLKLLGDDGRVRDE